MVAPRRAAGRPSLRGRHTARRCEIMSPAPCCSVSVARSCRCPMRRRHWPEGRFFFRSGSKANAGGYGGSDGSVGKVSTGHIFRYLQIGTCPSVFTVSMLQVFLIKKRARPVLSVNGRTSSWCRRVHRHVQSHAYRRVYGHVYGRVRSILVDMGNDMCVDMQLLSRLEPLTLAYGLLAHNILVHVGVWIIRQHFISCDSV